MKLTTKLMLLFLLLSILPLAVVGYIAFDSGRRAIEQNTIDRLISSNVNKENALERWLEDHKRSLQGLAHQPDLVEPMAVLLNHALTDPDYQASYHILLKDYLEPALVEEQGFLELFILRLSDGLIIVSTDRQQEGKYRESEPYFVYGQRGAYMQNVYYSLSLGVPAMTIATPIRDTAGRPVGVLAAHINLAEMSEIMGQRSGLSASEDTYLVNGFNFFVTEPRFGPGFALKKVTRTRGVEACLQQTAGVGFYDDYRGVPVIGAYRWLPERELCILTKVDQTEAFAPILALRRTIFGVGAGVALLVAVLGLLFARTITKPMARLVKGAEEFGRGNLDYRLPVDTADELGLLAVAFNHMAAQRKENEETQARLSAILEATPDFVATADAEGHPLYCNEAARRILGLAKGEDIVGKLIPDAHPAWANEIVLNEGIPTAIRAGVWSGETALLTYDGQEIPVSQVLLAHKTADGSLKYVSTVARDISERMRVEAELRASEERLSQALRAAQAGAWEWNMVTNQVIWSDENFLVLGLAPDSDRAGFETWLQCLHPQDRAEAERQVAQAIEQKSDLNIEFRVVWPDGSVHWLNDVGKMIFDEAGEPVGMYGIQLDITRRKQTELELRRARDELELRVQERTAALQASEARFRRLAENAQDLIYRYRLWPTPGFEYVSPAATAITGYTPEDHYADPGLGFKLVHPDDRPLLAAVAQGDTQPGVPLIFRWVRKDGATIWAEQRNVPIYDETGRLVALEGIARDITERKRAEEALRNSEERYRDIFENSPVSLWEEDFSAVKQYLDELRNEGVTDFSAFFAGHPEAVRRCAAMIKVVDVNESTLALYQAESKAQLLANLTRVLGEEVHRGFQEELVALAAGQKSFASETISQTTISGRHLHVNLKLTIAPDCEDTWSRVLVSITDITERIMAEQKLQQLNTELSRSNTELEQFAYVASHDLQEPLRMITSYLQLLKRRYAGKLDADADEFMAYAVGGAGRMKILINDLLAYSRVGTQGREFQPTDCEQVLSKTLADLQLAIEENGAAVTHHPLPVIMADEGQLVQLFQNLIGNALKFRNAAAPKVHISVEPDGQMWRFCVRDNGIGLEPEFAEQIFVIFQRLHNRDEYTGTGIGLAICKKIVERHGGRIWVESQPGQGAAFYFTLPVLTERERG